MSSNRNPPMNNNYQQPRPVGGQGMPPQGMPPGG